MISNIVLALAALCVVLLGLSMLFNPVQRSIGFANVTRRKWNSALVVAGSMVGTALIAGSLVMSDTSERALQDAAFAHLGEVDMTVRALESVTFQIAPITPDMVATVSLDALNEATDGQVDGVMTAVERDLPVVKVETDPNSPQGFRPVLAEPEVTVVGLDFSSLKDFGSSEPPLSSQPTLVSGQAYISQSLSKELELEPGDDIAVYYQNQPSVFRVARVLEDDGIAGLRIDQDDSTGTVLLSLSDAQRLMDLDENEVNAVLISNVGGVIEGNAATDAVEEAARDLLEESWPDVEWAIRHDKQNALSEGGGGPSTGNIFLMFSSFAILAGVMLIINIYAMLAEERRTEMGIMRAVAFSRYQLVMTFAYEGFVYSLIASVIGAIMGAALGALIVSGLSEIIAQDQSSSLNGLPLTIRPLTLLVSGAAGLLISFVTAFITSIRISRLNIVMAIRDLSDPEGNGPGRMQSIALSLVVIIGGLLTVMGFADADGYFQYIGPCVMLFSGAAVVGRFLPPRLVFTLSGAAIIAYSFLADRLEEVEILFDEGPGLFFISGIFMLLAGMMIIAFNLSLVLWVVRLGSAGLKRLEPIVHIAIAYPAVNRVRTATTMGMFGLVLFGVTLLTMYGGLLDGFITANLEKAGGGFDVVVYTTSSNRIEDLESELQASDEVDATQIASIMPVHRALVKFPDFERPKPDDEEDSDEPLREDDKYVEDSIHGVVADFAAQQKYPLEARMDQFATDADAWTAIISDPSLALVSARYDGTNDRADNALLDPGDTVRLLNPATGEIVEKTIAGRLEPIEVGFGVLWGVIVSTEAFQQDFAESSFRGDAPRLFVINVTDDTDLSAFGKQMEKALITTGAPVRVVRDALTKELEEISTFIRIFQGFLAFGLIVGVAGLGVIAARSVYQRRQGIGVLRALGFQPSMVLASLLIEWSFISLVGIMLGVGLGFLGGYRLWVLFIQDAGGAFTVPWFELIWISALVYVASLIFTIIPALKASRMSPVEALRHQE